MDKSEQKRKIVDEISRKVTMAAAAQGQLVQLGWEAYKTQFGKHMTESDLAAARRAYYMGAQHVFSSICQITMNVEDEEEASRLLGRINNELGKFLREDQPELAAMLDPSPRQ